MNIIIVGGGTAGYLSALVMSYKIDLASNNVTIIKSPNIPPIGVGESTVGSFVRTLINDCGINIDEFNFYVRPVTKHGIEFDFGNKIFHYTFDYIFDSVDSESGIPAGFRFKGGNYGNSRLSKHMIEKVNAHPNNESGAYHIENSKFLDYLERVLLNRGVKIISEEITDIKRDGDIIKSLNNKYKADYFIDCSGFKPILSNSKWYSYDNMLVNDRALVFQRNKGDSIRPYTQSTTMKSGWLWEIDHVDKTTCGYVYSSKYITDKKAKLEAEAKLDIIIDNSRVVKFKTGRLKKHWIGNVITLGNSDGFVEPLEATSIMVILKLSVDIRDITRYENKHNLIEKYNIFVNNFLDTIRDFVFIHFAYNKKLNTKYWKDYRSRSVLLQNCMGAELLEYYKQNNAHIKYHTNDIHSHDNPFGLEGWWSLFRGLEV